MDAWTAYEQADLALKRFDEAHEAKKQALILLAKALQGGGWGAVELQDPNYFTDAYSEIKPDHDPVNPVDLQGMTITQIVQERRALEEQYSAAFAALPESLRKTVRVASPRLPK